MTERSGQAHEAVPNAVASLAGMSWVEGYICDPNGQDVILTGRKIPARAKLQLDDLVVNLRNVWGRGEAPYCSLDPRKQDVLAVNHLLQSAGHAADPEQVREIYRQLKEVWGPQTVVVGGVPDVSRHAHVMIEADYHLKKAAFDLASLPEAPSYLDRTIAEAEQSIRQGRAPAMTASMTRFWFHLAASHPNFLVDDGVVRLKDCSVGVLTERQRATADGTLLDSGEEDPLARSFAQEFSAAFPHLAARIRVYGELENLYRLSALLRLMHMQSEPRRASLDLQYLLHEYRLLEPKPMPPSLPGLVNGKEKQFTIRQGDSVGTLFLLPMVCGGVGMDMRVTPDRMHRDTTMALPRLRLAAINQRPHRESLWWKVSHYT
jgi:hypothetical protein